MAQKNLLEQTQALVCQHFELQPSVFENKTTEDDFCDHLAVIITQMMQANMERFIHLLYRLDIPEHKAQMALNNQTSDPPAYALAQLIIEREREKIKSRAWYKEREMQASTSNDKTIQPYDDDISPTYQSPQQLSYFHSD